MSRARLCGFGVAALALLFAPRPAPAQDGETPATRAIERPAGPTAPPRIDEGRSRVTAEIEPVELEAHVAYLAEHCEGRATGTPGELRAAEYLAARLAETGLAPAGDALADGGRSYLQDIALVRRRLAGEPSLVFVDAAGARHALRPDEEFTVERLAAVDGAFPLVRIMGLEELGEDVPDLVATPESTGRATAWAARRGTEPAPLAVLTGGPQRRRAAPPDERPRRAASSRTAVLRVHRDWMERVLAGEFERVELRIGVEEERVPSHNVVARIAAAPRADEGAAQAIVLSAHFDHLGTREPSPADGADADLVFDGADDDASGVAAVLEIAEALALGPPPEREVVVLLATGEEMGLLGTLHYLDHPVVPLERTVMNLNFEMVGRPDPLLGPGRLWLTGPERTNLLAALRAAGFDVAPDPRPDQDFFRRSDNFAFARLGIVAQTLSSYGLHEDYHRPSDAWWTLDYEHMAKALGPALEIARLAASGELDPEWLEGGRPQ